MNQPIPIPEALKPFKPHGAPFATIESADHTMFYAMLGSVQKGTDADKKASFHVWVWSESPTGALSLISIPDPPNNAPTFAVVDGKLILCGVLESPATVYTAVERDVPGFVAPASSGEAVDRPARAQAIAATNLAKGIAARLGTIGRLVVQVGEALIKLGADYGGQG